MRRRLLGEQGGVKATLIEQIDTQAGDVVFADPNSDSKVYYRLDDGNDIIPKSFVPIGVVVIPALHDVYGTGACGVLSLKQMSDISPETGTTEWNDANSRLFVGDYKDYIENDLKDFCYVGKNGIVNKEVQGINPRGEGYLPTNMMIGINNPYDTKTYYYSSARFCSPSPYNEDGSRNPAYYQISPPSSTENALAYFNGRENTQIITSECDDPTIVEVCCSLYKTEGTKQGDWYFPSIAELGYVPPRINFIINAWNILSQYYEDIIQYPIEEELVSLGLTSTFYYQDPYIVRVDGSIFALPKDWGGYAFAFTQIGTLEKNYGDVYISGGAVSDIPASGGESQVSGYTYSQTYGYGDSTTNGGTITSGADISVTSISGDNLGTTETERTKIGESVLTVTMNGKTATMNYDVYQEANVITSQGVYNSIVSSNIPTAPYQQDDWMGAGGGTFTLTIYHSADYTSGSNKTTDVSNQATLTLHDLWGSSAYGTVEGNKVHIPSRGTTTGDNRYVMIRSSYNGMTCDRNTGQQYNDWWDGRLQAFWWSDWTTYRSVDYNAGEHSIIICCYRHYTSGAEGGGIDVTPSDACSISTSDSSTSISKWEGHYYFHYGRYNSSASRTIYINASYGGLTSPAIALYQTGINEVTSYGGLEITEFYWYNDTVKVNQKKNILIGFTCRRRVSYSFGNSSYEYSNPTSITLSTNTTNVVLTQPTYNDNPGTGYYRWNYSYKYTVAGTYSLTVNIVCWGQTYSATKTITVS